jgi:hypothetical protein
MKLMGDLMLVQCQLHQKHIRRIILREEDVKHKIPERKTLTLFLSRASNWASDSPASKKMP